MRAANGVIYKHVYAHRTGWADRYVHTCGGILYIHTQHTPRYITRVYLRVEFHERFKIGTRKPNKNNNNILLYTAAENIIILYRVIETGRKKKTTPNREVAAAEGGTRRISRRDQRMPLGGADTQYYIYTHYYYALTQYSRRRCNTRTSVCVHIVAPRRKIKE